MDRIPLSRAEQQTLARIERDLADEEPALDQWLRDMGDTPPPPRGPRRHRFLPTMAVGALLMLFVALLIPAAALSSPVLLWAFAVTWALALAVLVRLIVRRFRRATRAVSEDHPRHR